MRCQRHALLTRRLVLAAPCLTALMLGAYLDGKASMRALDVCLPALGTLTLLGCSFVAHMVLRNFDDWLPRRHDRGSRYYRRVKCVGNLAFQDVIQTSTFAFAIAHVGSPPIGVAGVASACSDLTRAFRRHGRSQRPRRRLCYSHTTAGCALGLVGTLLACAWLAVAVSTARVAGVAPFADLEWGWVAAVWLLPTIVSAVARKSVQAGSERLLATAVVVACAVMCTSGFLLGLDSSVRTAWQAATACSAYMAV